MAEVSKSEAVSGLSAVDAHRREDERRDGEPRREPPPRHPPPPGPGHGPGVADVASVLGLPAREVTPEVQNAIGHLMNEVERLRFELEQARERGSYLEDLADKDPLMPALNRRAFVRELARVIAHGRRSGAESSLVYLALTNGDDIRAQYGQMALEGALIHVGLILMNALRRSDVLGTLGGHGLGVILAVSDRAGAQAKAQELTEAIESKPFFWVGKFLGITIGCGVHALGAGETAESALAAADRDLRGHPHAEPAPTPKPRLDPL